MAAGDHLGRLAQELGRQHFPTMARESVLQQKSPGVSISPMPPGRVNLPARGIANKIPPSDLLAGDFCARARAPGPRKSRGGRDKSAAAGVRRSPARL